MQMVEQQIGGTQRKIFRIIFRYHPQIRCETGIVSDTRRYSVQFVLLSLIIEIREVYSDFFCSYRQVLGCSYIETAEISVSA